MPSLPLEITDEIINVLAQDDPSFSSTKSCALVCHEFYHLCRKHIFASIVLSPTYVRKDTTSLNMTITRATIRMLQQLLDNSPEIAHYIRSLSYTITPDDLSNSSLVETFKKITCLKSFTVWHIGPSGLQWNDNPLRPALLHLLHLPTLIHFSILLVENFLVSDLVPCVNLEQLEIIYLTVFEEIPTPNLPEKAIRLRNISAGLKNPAIIRKMCAMRCADGKPFIDFSGVNNLTIMMRGPNDVQASFDLLNRCDRLTSIDMNLAARDSSQMVNMTLVGLSKMLYPSMQTLKHVHMKNDFHEDTDDDPLAGFGNELEEMKNKNIIESITIEVIIGLGSDCSRGDEWGRLDTLAQPGWPKLQRVSLAIVVWNSRRVGDELERALKQLPQTQFPELSSSKSLSFEFSVRGEQLDYF